MDGYLVSLYQYIAKILQHYATSYFTEIFPLDQRPYVLIKVRVLMWDPFSLFLFYQELPRCWFLSHQRYLSC